MASHIKQVKWSLLDQALVSGTNFLLGIVLVRLLGLEEYGIFVLLWMVVQFFASIQMALIASPMMIIAPKKSGNEKESYLSTTIYIQIIFIFILTISAAFLTFTPDSMRPDWLNNQFLFPLISILIFFQFQDFSRRYFFVTLLPEKAFYIDVIAYGLQVPTIFIVLTYFPSFENAIFVIATAMFLSTLLSFRWLCTSPISFRQIIISIKHHWRSSKWLLGSAITQWLSGNYFLIISAILMGPVLVGSIKAAQNIFGIINIFFQALDNFMPSEASRRLTQNNLKSMMSYLYIVAIFSAIIVILFSVLVYWFRESITIYIYGSANENTLNAMFWLIPIFLLMALIKPLQVSLRGLEKTFPIFFAQLVSACISIISAELLIEKYQVNGVMLGMLFVQVSVFLILLFYVLAEQAKHSKALYEKNNH